MNRSAIALSISLIFLSAFATGVCQAQTAAGQSASSSSQAAKSSTPANDAAPNQRVVLKVGDLQVTQAAFENYIRELEEQQGRADLSRQALGDNYASMLMLSQKATAQHLDSSPDVLQQLAIDRTQILSNAAFAKLKQETEPTPAEISAYYSAHADDYDMVQIRRLFIWKKQDGVANSHGLSPQDAHALADAIRQAYASGGDAKKLIHDNKDAVLDVEPLTFQRGDLHGSLRDAAFSMKEGQWTQLDDTPTSLVLLQLVKKIHRSLPEVSPLIKQQLAAEKLRTALDDLKKKNVWMDEQYFAPAAAQKNDVSSKQRTGSAVAQSEKREEKNAEEGQK